MLKAICILIEIAQVLCNAGHRKRGSVALPEIFKGHCTY